MACRCESTDQHSSPNPPCTARQHSTSNSPWRHPLLGTRREGAPRAAAAGGLRPPATAAGRRRSRQRGLLLKVRLLPLLGRQTPAGWQQRAEARPGLGLRAHGPAWPPRAPLLPVQAPGRGAGVAGALERAARLVDGLRCVVARLPGRQKALTGRVRAWEGEQAPRRAAWFKPGAFTRAHLSAVAAKLPPPSCSPAQHNPTPAHSTARVRSNDQAACEAAWTPQPSRLASQPRLGPSRASSRHARAAGPWQPLLSPHRAPVKPRAPLPGSRVCTHSPAAGLPSCSQQAAQHTRPCQQGHRRAAAPA